MIAWPVARVAEALGVLARRAGLAPSAETIPPPPPDLADRGAAELGKWIESAAACLGLEAVPQEIRYMDVTRQLASCAPALLWTSGSRLLVLFDDGTALAPDLSIRRPGRDAIRAELCRPIEAPLEAELNAILDAAGIRRRRRARVRQELLQHRLGGVRLGYAWLVRVPPGTRFSPRLRLGRLVAAHTLQYALWILSWWVVGLAALQGRLDRGWLLAWILLLLTLAPLRALITWLQGAAAVSAGGMLKERLLDGALRLEPDEIRHQGAGQLLGRVLESEALEWLALNGGFLALVAAIELLLSAVVLALGAGGGRHAVLLVAWAGLVAALARRYWIAERRWTEARLDLTDDLVERMAGHRTRLAQEPREHWHETEDQLLERYQHLSRAVDHRAALLMAVAPRGWLVAALAGLAPAFISGASSPAALATSIGGVLLAYTAFKRLAAGLWNLVGAGISWRQVAPLFQAAARRETPTMPQAAGTASAGAMIEAHDLTFRYRDRGEPVLRHCSLQIAPGDRVLLEGPSGGGKSTLAALLSGMRRPESGLLLAGGLDRRTLGASGWLRRVAAAPQFHENHVLTGTFAFNLLMGRPGCLGPKDYEEAETICRELGLGPLLATMPAGMLQMVGETGWQLSHGERSRLYIARALLQGSDVLLFDESFAALDPENLRRALECVLHRAPTVVVIAHP